MIPAVAKSQVGRGSVAAPARLEAKADEILKVHRDAAKVAKARKLSPAFDAQCAAEDAPEPTNPSLSYLAGRYGLQVLFFIGLLAFVIWAWPVIVMFIKLIVMLPFLLLVWLLTPSRPRYRYYRRSW